MYAIRLPLWLVLALCLCLIPAGPVKAQRPGPFDVQFFLDAQPGPLKHYNEEGHSAAAIIEGAAIYYGVSAEIMLTLLEVNANLLSQPQPPPEDLLRPFGAVGPPGFAAQVDWAMRELRAGLGPYDRPPTLTFSDGVSLTLTLDQAPEGVAVQRLLARGRTSAAWYDAVERFARAFERYFDNLLVRVEPSNEPVATPASAGFLLSPWYAGTRVGHLSYFDHVYPTVDSGDDGNTFMVDYLGRGNVQYDGHDGHDYTFPDLQFGTPILAAAAGTAYARSDSRGLGIIILHTNGYETIYWHLGSFASIFDGRVGSNNGVVVTAGQPIGLSGATGVSSTPHLHFEVRKREGSTSKQVDPYGWYGAGSDPCVAYSGCLASTWLWHPSLIGSYDFTPPNQPEEPDTEPPVGTFSLNPPADLLFSATFDNHPVQSVGQGFPSFSATPSFVNGHSGPALALNSVGVTYPVSGNLELAAGTISLWAQLPITYPTGVTRHYLLAASANPTSAPYTGTLALRRETDGPDNGGPAWVFWTTAEGEATRDRIFVRDTLVPGWHHFAISWDAASGSKALYLDGELAASAEGRSLPTHVGQFIQLGRFTTGWGALGANLDDLAIYNRVLSTTEVLALATASPQPQDEPFVLHDRTVRIDTNAIDEQGGIMAVQLGLDGSFEDPQPYYDAYRWTLPVVTGTHTLAVRYIDRADNSATITRTISLELPPLQRVFLPLLLNP